MKKPKRQYRIAAGLIAKQLKGNSVIFDPDTAFFYSFNRTASFIFKGLKKGLSQPEIIKRMCKEYEIESATAQKDTQEIIRFLKKHKILIPASKEN